MQYAARNSNFLACPDQELRTTSAVDCKALPAWQLAYLTNAGRCCTVYFVRRRSAKCFVPSAGISYEVFRTRKAGYGPVVLRIAYCELRAIGGACTVQDLLHS